LPEIGSNARESIFVSVETIVHSRNDTELFVIIKFPLIWCRLDVKYSVLKFMKYPAKISSTEED
jgi:hypothetical protein